MRRSRGRTGSKRSRAIALGWVLVGALVVGACASEGGDADRADSADSSSEEAAPAAAGGGGDGEVLAGVSLATASRDVVSVASQEVAVDDVSAAVDEAVAIVEARGGLLFGEDSTYRETIEAGLVLKVPPGELGATLDELAGLGQLRSQGVSSDDVTEQVLDLESRIESSQASVARLRAFLGEAGSIDQLATVEGELLSRETELESLEAARRALESDVSMATVNLTLVDAQQATELGFLDGLEGGWEALQRTTSAALVVTGALLPFVPLVLLVILAVRYFGRRSATT